MLPTGAVEHPREWNSIMSGLPFADIREEGGYYIDRTLLIKDLIDTDANGVFMFTRPRAFGKSLNLTMLDAFFNIEHRGNTWFDGLEISKCPEYEKFKNAFPVIRLDLGDARTDTYSSFIHMVQDGLWDCFDRHSHLLKSEKAESSLKELFHALGGMIASESETKTAIVSLSRALAEEFGVNPIILIDDYDRPISKHFGMESHKPMMRFLSEFLRLSIDENPYRGMVCIMGVMPIDMGLKDVIENNIISGGSSERFGFTESESGKVLEDFGYPDGLGLMKEWHGGYRFGNTEVLNPCCVIRYGVERGKQYLYWTSSSSLASVRHMVRNVSGDGFIDVLKLVTGNSILSGMEQRFSYGPIWASDVLLYSYMATVGYLRAVPTDIADGSGRMQYRLSIPNRDVARAVYLEMRGAHPLSFTSVERFKRAISEGNEEEAEAIMARMMDDRAIASFGDRAWRIMMLELVYEMSEGCETRIEAPSEGGWIGISFGPKAQGLPGIVLALDTADGEKDPDAGAAEALERARDSKLLGDMRGRTILVGTAFKDGIPKVKIGSSMNGDGSASSDAEMGGA